MNAAACFRSSIGWITALLCVVACSKEPCAEDCKWFGKCTPKGSECVAATDADCRRSDSCRDYGRCTAKEGTCHIGGPADCRQAAPCRLDGRCVPGPKDKCVAGSDADCAASDACRARGLCVAMRGVCSKR